MKVSIFCPEYGLRGGISSFTERLRLAMKNKGVETKINISKFPNEGDIILVQYHPAIIDHKELYLKIRESNIPVIIHFHDTTFAEEFEYEANGYIFMAKHVIPENWSDREYIIFRPPGISGKQVNKKEMRKKYGIPEEKFVIGTAGFLTRGWKAWSDILDYLIKNLDVNREFLYFVTSPYSTGDGGMSKIIKNIAKHYKKDESVKINEDFSEDEIFWEKLNTVDAFFLWNNTNVDYNRQISAIASDLYNVGRHLIIQDIPHYSFLKNDSGISWIKTTDGKIFIDNLYKIIRSEKVRQTPKIKPEYTWNGSIDSYIKFLERFV